MAKDNNESKQGFTGFLYDQGDRIALLKRVLKALGNPDTDFSIIHVCGTNGKGSTSKMIADLLGNLHHHVGLFTSPFIGDITNSIQIDSKNIGKSDLNQILDSLKETMSSSEFSKDELSSFEAQFVAAMIYFSKQNVDFVVLECGLGGELDATNAVMNTLYSIFTRIGLDHIGILGDTIAEIATTKSKIIRPGNTTVVAPNQRAISLEILQKEAHSKGSRLINASKVNVSQTVNADGISIISYRYGTISGSFKFSLLGTYQLENVATVLTWLFDFARKNRLQLDYDHLLSQTLGSMTVPGRFEAISSSPKIILDGAHNLDAIGAFVDTVQSRYTNENKIFVTGFLKDKDYQDNIRLLTTINHADFKITQPNNPDRALSAKSLEEVMTEETGNFYPSFADPIAALNDAILDANQRPNTIIFVVGSFYLLNPIRTYLKTRSEH